MSRYRTQDLDGFNLDDYRPFSDVSGGMDRLARFLRVDLESRDQQLIRLEDGTLEARNAGGKCIARFTTDREVARMREDVDLLGLDHPMVQAALLRHGSGEPEELGTVVCGNGEAHGVVTWGLVEARGTGRERTTRVVRLAVDPSGTRLPLLERCADDLFNREAAAPTLDPSDREVLLREIIEPMLHRELMHTGAVPVSGGFHAELVGWVEVAGAA